MKIRKIDFQNEVEEIKFFMIDDGGGIAVRCKIKRGWWIFKRTFWEWYHDLSGYPITFNTPMDAIDYLKEIEGVDLGKEI